MRLFIAVELPEDARRHASKVRGAWETSWRARRVEEGGVRWSRLETLHITLKFLGEVDDPAVPGLCDALRTLPPIEPFRLYTEGMLLFPERGPVRVVAAGVGGDTGRLVQLHASIESACEALGYGRERREYKPHITVGRSRDGLRADVRGAQFGSDVTGPGPLFEVSQVALMQSRLLPSGPEYTPVAHFPLNRPAESS